MKRMNVAAIGFVGLVSMMAAACGTADVAEEHVDLEALPGKADIPSWLRHIPTGLACNQTVTETFAGFDSAHMYSFPGEKDQETHFAFDASYSSGYGAALAIYDAETGKRVGFKRRPFASSVALDFKAPRSVKYLVAVYSVSWTAYGTYTLAATCAQAGCKDNADCAPGNYCKQDQCGEVGTGLGTCEFQPQICNRLFRPVCGCDGRTYGNACEAAAHGVSVREEGECLEQKRERCEAIAKDYKDALHAAQSCNPFIDIVQCTQPVPAGLGCAGVCTAHINTTLQASGLEGITDAWKAADCDSVPWICPAYFCPPATGSACEPNPAIGGAAGFCRTLFN